MDEEKQAVVKGLKKAVTPLVQSQLAYWYKNAPKEELLGAKVLIQICETEGSELLPELSDPDLSQESMTERSQTMSVYSSDYSARHVKARSELELLRYHSLRELPFSVVLQENAFLWVENWLGLSDNEKLVTSLLSFLRGIHSVVKVNCVFPSSLQRACYVWYSKRDFIQAARLKPRPKVVSDFASVRSAISSYPTRDSSPSFAIPTHNNVAKLIKQRELQGSTSLLRSSLSDSNLRTTYDASYIIHFNPPKLIKPLVPWKSVSLGLCPELPEREEA